MSQKTLCPYTGKQQYMTEQEARAQLREFRKGPNRGNDVRGLHVYKCGCRSWHVGHKPQKAKTPLAAQPKQPSPGQLRRAARRELEAAQRHVQRAKAYYDVVGDAADMADSALWAKRMEEELLGPAPTKR